MAMPMMAANLLEAIALLAGAAEAFGAQCVEGITANVERCGELIERSLAMCTALAKAIGYDAAAEIAKQALAEGKTVREIAEQKKVLPADQLNKLLDPRGQADGSGD